MRHSLWHLRRHMSFQLGTWCWLTQTVRAHASAQASSSDTPQTVTQVSGIGSFENAPTFFSILFDVHTLSQTKISSEFFSLPRALCNLCSSACLFFMRKACPATTAGMAAKRDHHTSTITTEKIKLLFYNLSFLQSFTKDSKYQVLCYWLNHQFPCYFMHLSKAHNDRNPGVCMWISYDRPYTRFFSSS